MTKSVRVPEVRKTQLRYSAVPDTARFMWLFGDPLLAKNIKKHNKVEYTREHRRVGSRRELKRYEDVHPEKKSTDAFLNMFPQVARNPLGFSIKRARMPENEQEKNFESETQILRDIIKAELQTERDSTSWKNFKKFRQAVLDESLENPLVPLLNYVDDNENRYFEDAELVVWLFLVLIEHQFLSYGCRVGFSEILIRGITALDDVSKFEDIEGWSTLEWLIPIHAWIPKCNAAGGLSTTRYNVMHHMVQNYLNPEERERNHKHLHGNEYLTLKKGKHERTLCMNTALGAFYNPAFPNEMKNLLMLLFRAAEVMEMFQLVEFRVGLCPANRIVEEYSKFNVIADEFYSSVKRYRSYSQ